jgi:hypothetical protein
VLRRFLAAALLAVALVPVPSLAAHPAPRAEAAAQSEQLAMFDSMATVRRTSYMTLRGTRRCDRP